MAHDHKKPIKITISCPESGEILEEKILHNDYMLLCAGDRYLHYLNVMGQTHILYIKRGQPE